MRPPLFEVILLGNAQDAGLPQAGCPCERCQRAREDASLRRFAASLGILDHGGKQFWVIDATPDFREQLNLVWSRFPTYSLAGIFLTHAHTGHYTGLIHLGKEGWNTKALPVYLTTRMRNFLAENQPWSEILAHNLAPQILAPGQPLALNDRLSLVPLLVPHRDEFSDTLAFQILTSYRPLFYCPDIDSWQNFDLKAALEGIWFALLDGSFYSAAELPGRDLSKIPHPLAPETVAAARGLAPEIYLVHLNHSNPLHDRGPEREQLFAQGIQVAEQGQQWVIL